MIVTSEASWRTGAPGKELCYRWLVFNESAGSYVTVDVELPVPANVTGVRWSVSLDTNATSTAQAATTYGVGPFSDSLTLPPEGGAVYEVRATIAQGAPLGTNIVATLTVDNAEYPVTGLVARDDIKMPRNRVNPDRFNELLLGVGNSEAMRLLEVRGYDFLNNGGSLWHIIDWFVQMHGWPDQLTRTRQPSGTLPFYD